MNEGIGLYYWNTTRAIFMGVFSTSKLVEVKGFVSMSRGRVQTSLLTRRVRRSNGRAATVWSELNGDRG